MIISKKTREEEMLSESIADIIVPTEVALVLSSIDLAGRYNWAISNIDLDVIRKLGLIDIKKY